MKSLHRNINEKSLWENYKELELIPNSISEPSARKTFSFGIDRVWRVLIVALTQELVYEQQVEYIQRCWERDYLGSENDNNSWQQLWTLMN